MIQFMIVPTHAVATIESIHLELVGEYVKEESE